MQYDLERIKTEIADSFDEELEMQMDEDHSMSSSSTA